MIVRTLRIFLDLSKSLKIKKFRSLLGYMVGIWSKNGQGWKMVKQNQNLDSSQNGFAYSGKFLADFRRVSSAQPRCSATVLFLLRRGPKCAKKLPKMIPKPFENHLWETLESPLDPIWAPSEKKCRKKNEFTRFPHPHFGVVFIFVPQK